MSQPDHTPVRLLLIDDHHVLRLGLKALLDDGSSIAVVGDAGTLAEGLALTYALRPDVVLMDLRLPDGRGVDGCREIRSRYPKIRVLFLTSYVDDEALFATVLAGAQGYVLKDVSGDVLAQAVRTVAGGGAWLDPSVADRARARIDALAGPTGHAQTLSPQERRILGYLTQGLTNKEIAVAMNLSEKTIRNYLTSVFTKLNVSRRTEAVALYMERLRPLTLSETVPPEHSDAICPDR